MRTGRSLWSGAPGVCSSGCRLPKRRQQRMDDLEEVFWAGVELVLWLGAMLILGVMLWGIVALAVWVGWLLMGLLI